MTNKELYEKAKEAYYNGEPIMSDIEFDELERSLGLENTSYVGTRHNPSYTEKHPIIMGSLSKVQVHEKNGKVDWTSILQDVKKYINYSENNVETIITPKFDGCSFEAVIDNNQNIISISTRGDGEYGKNIRNHIEHIVKENLISQYKVGNEVHDIEYNYILRGEVLVDKNVYMKKYADKYVNPRSFVAGVLGNDFDVSNKELMESISDLEIVVYVVKVVEKTNEKFVIKDIDWTDAVGLNDKPQHFKFVCSKDMNEEEFERIYNEFDEYRKECKYALDGFVIKPVSSVRINEDKLARPKDCVAIKFIPMLQETVVTDIVWNLGKTNELVPIVHVKPVEMDGKMISKCSGHNYGYLINNKVSIGTKVILSLAGDIIPFLYKVTDTSDFSEEKLGNIEYDTEVVDEIHLMALLDEIGIKRNRFICSATNLNIPGIGRETAKAIFEYIKTNSEDVTSEFFASDSTPAIIPFNILLTSPDEIYFGAGAKKAGSNARKSFLETLHKVTLSEIICSCGFKFCGDKASKQVANYLMGLPYSFEHLPNESFNWATNKNSDEFEALNEILNNLGKNIDDFKEHAQETVASDSERIPVILTGEPNGFSSKAEFLSAHPEYKVTGSWKEVKIVFTNSLESNTGKMKKAREKNIEIKLY